MAKLGHFKSGPRSALDRLNPLVDAHDKGYIVSSEDVTAERQSDGRIRLTIRGGRQRAAAATNVGAGSPSGVGTYLEFYMQTTADNRNAGSTNSDAPVFTSTNGNWNSTTRVFTLASGSITGIVVGDFVSIFTDASTVTGYVARVTAVSGTTVTTSATVSAGSVPATAATGISLRAGGAWKGFNGASGFPFTLNNLQNIKDAATHGLRVNIKSGVTYAITASMTCNAGSPVTWQGYDVTPGDGGRVIIDGGSVGASYVLLSVNGNGNIFRDLIFQNNGATGNNGAINTGQANLFERVIVHNVRGVGMQLVTGCTAIECEAYACNQSNTVGTGTCGFFSSGTGVTFIRCISHHNAGSNNSGFVAGSSTAYYIDCIADSNGLAGFNLQGGANGDYIFIGCVAYGNGASGVILTTVSERLYAESCILASNGTFGFDFSGATVGNFVLRNNAYYNNGSGAISSLASNALIESDPVTLTADPFINAAGGDFRPTATAATLGLGRGKFTQTQGGYTGSQSFPDIGACQAA